MNYEENINTASGDSRKPDLPGFDDIPRPKTTPKEPKPQPAPAKQSEANPRPAPTAPVPKTVKKKKSKFREFIGPDFSFSKYPDTESSMTFNSVYKYLILPVIALLSVILIPVMLTLVEKLRVLAGGYSYPRTIETVGLCYYSALCIISAVTSIYLIYAFDRNKKSALFVNYYYWIFLCFSAFCATGIFWLDYLPEFAYYWHEKGYLLLVLSHYRSLYFIEGIITVISARIIHIYYSKRCSEFTN
ncbi:MAG: hypothetical protein SPJ42_02585 [Oscillospiraceae bacterium]|nr:hypothetical protein [Oscillospiraceae bacterium]